MPTSIDGQLLLGSVSFPGTVNAILQPSDASVGIVRIEDPTKTNLADVDAAGDLHVTGEAAGGAPVSGSVAVGTGATLILAAQATRRMFSVTNPELLDPTNVLYIGGATVAVGSGIPLYPGETYEETEATGAWYGIFATTGLTVPFLSVIK